MWESEASYQEYYQTLRGEINEVNRILRTLFEALQHDVSQTCIDLSLWDSLTMLSDMLSRVIRAIFNRVKKLDNMLVLLIKVPDFSRFSLRNIPDLRQSAKWCPRERRAVCNMMGDSPCGLAFVGQISRKEDPKRHVKCTESSCEANQVDKQTYSFQHGESYDGSCSSAGIDHPENMRLCSGGGWLKRAK